MLQEVIGVCCDQFYALFGLLELWYYDQQKLEVGRGRDWEKWDSGCHRTSDSYPSSNFDIQSMCSDIMNIFRFTIVTCRPIWKWSVSSILWALFLREISTACLDMKEDRNNKSALVCDGWSAFLDAASDLPRFSYSRWKSITWFISSDSWEVIAKCLWGAGKRLASEFSLPTKRERCASDNWATSLPFSDHRRPQTLLCLPSPNLDTGVFAKFSGFSMSENLFLYLQNHFANTEVLLQIKKKNFSNWLNLRKRKSFN